MKKLWLLTACCFMLLAKEPSASEAEHLTNTIQKTIELSTELPAAKIAPLILLSAPVQLPPPNAASQVQLTSEEELAALAKAEQEIAQEVKSTGITIDLGQVFAGSPTIYSLLFILSIASVGIWSYTLMSLRNAELFPQDQIETLRNQIQSHDYDSALKICQKQPTLLFGMVATALQNRHQGPGVMMEMMRTEGKRMSVTYWQKISLLNEIAVIAPMVGLLGTVLGLFYAFYDLSRSAESISALFDGLGISVGTTLGGLVVAIFALMFHALTKYRLMRQLSLVESRAEALIQSIDTPSSTQR